MAVLFSSPQLSNLQQLPELSDQHILSLLHIAVNGQKSSCACQLLKWLLQDADSSEHRAMLRHTWRRHTAAMQQLQQHVNQPRVLRKLLQMAVYLEHSDVVALLCQMPAANQLSVDDAGGLINACLGTWSGSRECINIPLLRTVCRSLPGAQLLPVTDLTAIFNKVLYLLFDYAEDLADVDHLLQVLAGLPAAKQVDEETAAHFLRESLHMGLSFHKPLQPVQQLEVATVRKIIFDTLDWYG
jgi:hypothetical protein